MAPSRQLRIAVLSGGRSSEREVSLVTARGVLEALNTPDAQRPVEAFEVRLETSGAWSVGDATPQPPTEALGALAGIDAVFVALHGGEGEDGTLQGFLQGHGLRYTGSGVRSSALCMDKQALRLLAAEEGLAIPPGFSVSRRHWDASPGAVVDRALSLGPGGWFVKPRLGGSSVATSAVLAPAELPAAIEQTLATGEDALVEGWVHGVEVSCGVLGDFDGALESLMPIEIQPTAGTFFDYEQKYDAEVGARELCPPPSLDEAVRHAVRERAEWAHRLAGCEGYSRIDFICPPEAEPVLLEINTLPGLTPRSLLPQEAAHRGLGYRDLVLSIIDRALARAPRP